MELLPILAAALLADLLYPSTLLAADNDVKSTTEFVGTCTKGTFMDKDVTGGCYGRVFSTVYKSGRVEFIFYVGDRSAFEFSGGKDSTPTKGSRVVEIDTVRVRHRDDDLGDKPAKGTCTVDGDISDVATVRCQAEVEEHSIEFDVNSTQPASFHDSFPVPSSDQKIIVRYWDNLNATCTKAFINADDETSKCKGTNHVGFGIDRADFIMGVDGHLVAFSGDQERGLNTGHYILYVNRLYYDKDSTPADGKCVLDGDYQGKSKVVCDADAVTVDNPFHAHAEFDVSAVTHADFAKKN